jgi:hypothetical protein
MRLKGAIFDAYFLIEQNIKKCYDVGAVETS